MRAILTIGGGFVLLVTGALLLIPLPEAGLPALLIGLRLLGRHYAWARTANDKLDQAVRTARRHWNRLPRALRFAIFALLLIGTALIIYILVR
ncbi:PGPGW domain-containing protein [Micromonospora chersina]|uniref:PGPGW domain-containing protein n=1 Tax=Micromonospora chersina TaxID=47854 RepID=UPI00142F29F7|nr:PGPGW domain-containing protein [Micromonospora chersina]